jgi:tetratricopeptide (TPR) repeat protein
VRAVIVDLNDLIKKILSDRNQRQHNKTDEAFSISIFSAGTSGEGQSTSEINGQFIHSQLLIDCLTRMKTDSTNINELISLCKKEYEGNDVELAILYEFEEHYSANDALWWYTRHSFLYRQLNKALRVQNIDLLFLFRFFIRDIEQQLENIKCTSSIHVYRGQLMSKDEVEILKNNTGQFISINSFLSTSIDRELARLFIAGTKVSNGLERVFFEINADPSVENIKPFGDITSCSFFSDEKEVLFMIGSIFQLVHVDHNQDGIWMVQMRLCSGDGHQSKSLLQFLKNKYNNNENTLISFGDVLVKMDKLNDAEKYYHRCLNEASSDQRYIARCYYSLGVVAIKKFDLDSSLIWLNKSLYIILQTSRPDDPEVAKNYNSIGRTYRKKGDLDQAIEMFETALSIWKKKLDDNSVELAKCYSDIGKVYQRKQIFSKALECHRMTLHIHEKNLPEYHGNLGSSHVNIASVHRCLGEYDLSLKHANLALEIFQKALPAEHNKIGWVFENIGLVYEQQGKLEESISYLKKAVNTYRQRLPANHYYIIGVERSIQRVLSQLK